jgi:hypothetical protein
MILMLEPGKKHTGLQHAEVIVCSSLGDTISVHGSFTIADTCIDVMHAHSDTAGTKAGNIKWR